MKGILIDLLLEILNLGHLLCLITEGANASADYSNGVAVMTFSKGGLMYEASIGGQKFGFRSY